MRLLIFLYSFFSVVFVFTNFLIRGILYSSIMFIIGTFLGGFLSTFFREFHVFDKFLGGKLLKFCNIFKIPRCLIPALFSSFINARLEHTIVYDYYRRGFLNDWYLIYYNLVLSPLRFLSISIVYIIPQAITALGFYVGMLYIVFSYIKSMLTSILAFSYYKIFRNRIRFVELEYDNYTGNIIDIKYQHSRDVKSVLKISVMNGLNMLKSLSLKFFIILSIVYILYILNIFEYLNVVIKNMLSYFSYVLNSQSLTIISLCAFSPVVGIYIAGSMLYLGLISVKQVLLSIFIGNMLFILFFDFIKHSFPFYVSIYPVKVAVKLTLSIVISTLITTPIILLMI